MGGKTTVPALGHIGPEVRSFYSVDDNTCLLAGAESRRARRTTPGQLTVHTPRRPTRRAKTCHKETKVVTAAAASGSACIVQPTISGARGEEFLRSDWGGWSKTFACKTGRNANGARPRGGTSRGNGKWQIGETRNGPSCVLRIVNLHMSTWEHVNLA